MELSEDKFEEVKEAVRLHLKGHEKRYIHILGVVEMSEYLAKRYNVPVLEAKFAAMLHDYSKYDKDISALNEEERQSAEKYAYLAHGYLSCYEAEHTFGITNRDVLNAIKNHVVGRVGMTRLEEIVFIADYTEKNRVYDDCVKCRDILINKGIDEAILYSLESSIAHSESAHPIQSELVKIYKEKVLCLRQ